MHFYLPNQHFNLSNTALGIGGVVFVQLIENVIAFSHTIL